VRRIGSSVLARWLRDGEAVVVDLETSKRYLAGHIPGASWALRADLAGPALAARLGRPARLVLTSDDGYLAAWAAADLIGDATVPAEVFVLAGGTRGWEQSGRAAESGRDDLLSAAGDVYRRPYEGTGVDPAVMQAYLDWEYGLVAQLDRDGTHGFSVLVA
jgi:rhodanese-related sulfurtransferase